MAGQRFGFSIGETACAEAAGVRMYDLHFDVDAICRAYEAIVPVAERLGVEPPRPRLADEPRRLSALNMGYFSVDSLQRPAQGGIASTDNNYRKMLKRD